MPNPLTIVWDIETTHNVVAAFQLKNDDYIPHQNILKERYIVCAAWKILGKSKIHSISTLTGNDKAICTQLHHLLSNVDIAIAHNGDNFDLKFVETRMLYHGLSPLPPITKIDTLKIARRRFRFNSNRLDYLGRFLGVGQKLHTGNDLWLKVLEGDQKAILQLSTYNKQDVLLLERVFKKLQPYVPTRLIDKPHVCGRCGARQIHYRGYRRTAAGLYPRTQCQSCGGWDTIPKLVQRFETRVV